MAHGEELVEVFGLEGPVEDLARQRPEGGSDQALLVNLEGCRGRVLGRRQRHCLVETFDGSVANVLESNLRSFQPCAPGSSSSSSRGKADCFDLLWPSDPQQLENFNVKLSEVLRHKGYCLIQMFSSLQLRKEAAEEALKLRDWRLPTKDFEVPYLGYQNSTKYAPIHMDASSIYGMPHLSECDLLLTHLGSLLEPLTESFLGFRIAGRQSGMVRVPLGGDAEDKHLRPAAMNESFYDDGTGKVFAHLNWMDRRRLCAMFFVESEGGELILHPATERKGSQDVRLPLSANQLLVFLPDQMAHTYRPLGRRHVAVQTFYVTKPFLRDPNDSRVVDMPEMYQGERIHVTAMNMRFAGHGYGIGECWSMWVSGTDCCLKLPSQRWDVDEYYSPEKFQKPLYTCHGAPMEDHELANFDGSFFGICDAESDNLSFAQRKLLEVGFETLCDAGFSKEACRGLPVGVYTGDAGTDWYMIAMDRAQQYLKDDALTPFIRTGFELGITASRLSHTLGLRGPTLGIDTACSSSLVCTGHACRSLVRELPDQSRPSAVSDIDKALVMGVSLLDGCATFMAYCAATMLSDRGRCFTFDESANGFARGEGVGGMMLQLGNTEEEANLMLACVIGSNVNQDGRSASMTAPHGPSQQQCIKASMREAGLKPSQITIAECHGTGTALGDPIEVGALREVMKDRDEDAIIMTSGKSNFGHMEACAGLGGLAKCITMLNATAGGPNVHLRSLNPHIDFTGYPAIFIDELVDVNANRGVSGVSSFGVGGTNARGDLWGRCVRGHKKTLAVNTFQEARLRANLFSRVQRHGSPGPAVGDEVCLVREGNGWCAEKMLEIREGCWEVTIRLGTKGRERFRFLLNEDPAQSFYPESNDSEKAGYYLGRGPDWGSRGRAWSIDGHGDGASAGDAYTIRFTWSFSWAVGEVRHVTWQRSSRCQQDQAV